MGIIMSNKIKSGFSRLAVANPDSPSGAVIIS
jgi:hypothetical protein